MEVVRREAERCYDQVNELIDGLEKSLLATQATLAKERQKAVAQNNLLEEQSDKLLEETEQLSKVVEEIAGSVAVIEERVRSIREMRFAMEALLDKLPQN